MGQNRAQFLGRKSGPENGAGLREIWARGARKCRAAGARFRYPKTFDFASSRGSCKPEAKSHRPKPWRWTHRRNHYWFVRVSDRVPDLSMRAGSRGSKHGVIGDALLPDVRTGSR